MQNTSYLRKVYFEGIRCCDANQSRNSLAGSFANKWAITRPFLPSMPILKTSSSTARYTPSSNSGGKASKFSPKGPSLSNFQSELHFSPVFQVQSKANIGVSAIRACNPFWASLTQIWAVFSPCLLQPSHTCAWAEILPPKIDCFSISPIFPAIYVSPQELVC